MSGDATQPSAKPGVEVSDQFGFFSEDGQFCQRSAAKAVRAHDYCRGLSRAKPRGLWNLAASGARAVPDCLASLRPSERARASSEVGEAECGSEWSGCKAGESVIVRGPNSAEAVSLQSGRTAALGAMRSRWATRGATAPGSHRASVRSVKPGCFHFQPRSEATRFQCLTPRLKPFDNLNRWKAR